MFFLAAAKKTALDEAEKVVLGLPWEFPPSDGC
jgi:hypothetical protein